MTLPTDPRDDQARIPQQAAPAQPQPVAEPTTAPARRRRWPWIAGAAAVALALAGGAAFALMPSDSDEAVDRCQAAVTDKLQAPSTAKYSDTAVDTEDGNFGRYYSITGAVDAQNGFGAVVRGEYLCKVSREKDGSWLVTTATVTQH